MKISVSAIFAVTIFGATAPSAGAHDWYPHECCHDKDCAPVESMTRIVPAGDGTPYMVVTSKHGKAILIPILHQSELMMYGKDVMERTSPGLRSM